MRGRIALACICASMTSALAIAQTTRRAPPKPPLAPPVKEAPAITCPAPLGSGINTKRSFCDVLTGRDPAAGILISIPPHEGDVTLTFDLHNRHTNSEEQMKDKRTAFARYTTSVGALTMDNTLISRAAVQSEFRTAADLLDRIGGGAGPGGLKAVAPTGQESITLTIPEAENQVSILGEKLVVERAEGSATYTSAGRPIAIVSNVMIEYHPPAPPKPVVKTPPKPVVKTPVKPAPKAPARRPRTPQP
jgi:hypothetical protein